MEKRKKVLITGSSGFIGDHLVRYLQAKGYFVIGADIVNPKYTRPDVFYLYDLRNTLTVNSIFNENEGIDEVYNLACLMGGMGYIGDDHHAHDIMTGSTMIIANILNASVLHKVPLNFFSSSACVYNESHQMTSQPLPLHENMAYPANPDLDYGWQKLFSERMYKAANKAHNLNIRIARFHNVFGPMSDYASGKEKAPAALCRKIAIAQNGDEIEVWGDGLQKRSFLYIDECLNGIDLLMSHEYDIPLNIGSGQAISINDLALMIIDISGKKLTVKNINSDKIGVRGRVSDNTLIETTIGWRPKENLVEGLRKLYYWINNDIHNE